MAQFDALLEQLKVEAVKRGPTWLEEKLRPLLVPDIGERADKEAASPRPVRLSRPPVRLDPDSEGSNGGRRRSSPSPGVKSTMKKRTGSSSGSRHVEAEIRHPAIPSSSSVSIAEQVRVSEKEGDYLPKEGNEIGSRPVNPLGFLVVGNDGLSGEAYGLQESWTDNIRLDIEDGVPMAGRPNSRGEEAGAERSQQEMAITETRTPGFQNREKVTAASQVDQSTAAQDFGSVEPFSGACSSGRCSRNEFPGSIMEAWGGGLAELIKNSLAPGVRIVWVMGHSFIYWANAEASKKMGGLQLGCPVGQWEVKWFGIRRMCWELLFPVFVEYSKVFHHPDVLVLHLGGNDLGIIPQKELVRRIKRDLGNIKDLYPEIKIIWSQITPRLVWRSAWDYDKLERSRKK
ncbi:uncharacterized protein LOC128651511 isoform X3 [Bombina bombina]|uniref:uncharacterized protein LOC128651511 isoform X3 n=1 Tax=Bombina bombina TaxID=8345 RepID=UPI00235B2073|nr:uncharacterized protein LOC128651511 isoform X3 [Bombina bombina]